MKRFYTPVLLLTLLAACVLGCRNTSVIIATGLRVELTAITNNADGTVSASWRMVNPNIASYLLSSTSHKVYLNGVLLGTITDHEPLGVPASTSVDRASKLGAGDAAASRTLAEAMTKGSGNYRVDSQIVIRIYDETVEKATLTNSGTVPVVAK